MDPVQALAVGNVLTFLREDHHVLDSFLTIGDYQIITVGLEAGLVPSEIARNVAAALNEEQKKLLSPPHPEPQPILDIEELSTLLVNQTIDQVEEAVDDDDNLLFILWLPNGNALTFSYQPDKSSIHYNNRILE